MVRKRPKVARDHDIPSRQPSAPAGQQVNSERVARIAPERKGSERPTLVVRLNRVDVGSPWCLSRISAADLSDLLGRLRSIESMTIEGLSANRVWKDYKVEDVPNKDAAKRLQEIQLDDLTQISRLQISGLKRLYGFRQGNELFVLWWDPMHEIWPSSR